VKVLLDECIDWRLSRDIVGHEVKSARQMGWATTENGELLALASKHFDVFVTVDQNLSFQQNLGSLPTLSPMGRGSAPRPPQAISRVVSGGRPNNFHPN
jgi:hypothetical protein